MGKLNSAQKGYLRATLGSKAEATITDLEASPNTQALMTRLMDTINAQMAGKTLGDGDPRLSNYGTAEKAYHSTPTLADLQAQQKALNARIKAQSRKIVAALKDATEAAEAEAVSNVMQLADNLQLSQNAVMELIKKYSLVEVTSILETLATQKAMKGYVIDPFFGERTTRIEAASVEQLVKKQYAQNHPDDFFS